jgi:hypothetical protein
MRDAGDVRGALEKLKAAYSLAETPVIGVELGRTYRMAGLLVEARETFLQVARLPTTSDETSRSTDARHESADLAEQLAGKIPTVTIVVRGMPGDQVVVTVDGQTVPNAALSTPRLVNPGTHTIVATAGAARDEARVELRESESKTVELKSARQVSGPAAPPQVDVGAPGATPDNAPRSVAPWIVGGVGVAGLVVGGVMGGLVLHDKSVINDPTQCSPTQMKCTAAGLSAEQQGRSLGPATTAALVVGVLGVGSAAVWLVVRKPAKEASSGALTTLRMGASATPTGGAWRMQGSF